MARLLVRAIGPAGAPAAGRRVVEAGRVCAWVDEVPARLDRAALIEHHRVVEQLGDCLPARFGTVVQDETALVEMLRAREEELLERLERMKGKRELAVTGLWAESEPEQPAETAEGGPGRRYMERRRARARREERARALAEQVARAAGVAEEDARHLVPGARAAGDEGPGGAAGRREEVAFSSALLVEAERAAEIKARLEGLSLEGVRLLVNGPWPPYTFAG